MPSPTEESHPFLQFSCMDQAADQLPSTQSSPLLPDNPEAEYSVGAVAVSEQPRKRNERIPPQTCEICGERAKSFHYDVASCNGCRTFFRRTIGLFKSYVCLNGGRWAGKCASNMYRNCRACRFDRCILSGMTLEQMKLPASFNVPQAANAIAHRRQELLSGKHSTPFKYHIRYHETLECRELDSLIYIESRCHGLRQIIDPCDQATTTLRANILERCRLDEVKISSTSSGSAPAFEFAGRTYDYKSVGMKRIWISVDVFLFVETAKTLPVFEKLSLEDKEVLLVHVALATTALTRVFYSLAMQSNVLIYPDGSIPMLPFFKTGLEDELLNRIMQPMIRVGLSVDEFVLLKAIIYCSPDAEDLSMAGKNALQAERESYAGLLLRHLQRKLGATIGAKKYAEVIALVDAYFHFGLKHREHCLLIGVACRPPTLHRLRMVEDIFRGYVNRQYSNS